MKPRRCASRWAQRFFGLTPDDKPVFLEQIFLLMYYSGFSYSDAYRLPVWQRIWFITRINEEIKKSQGSSRGHESPDERAWQGKHRPFPPSNQRRFT